MGERKPATRRLAAILAADVAGYSRLMRSDEAGTLKVLKDHLDAVIAPKIAEHDGRIVKLMGDGVLAEFASVLKAVHCALEIQTLLAERNRDVAPERRMLFRMGLNLGDVLVENGDIHGDGVNLAARLEGLAEPGGLCVSDTVYQQVRNRTGTAFEDLGEQRVKGLPDPIRAYRASLATLEASQPREAGRPVFDRPSIAVLPFANMSGDPQRDYVSDGITEDIITELSRFRSLRVIARNSSFTYKGRSVRAQEVGRDLGVGYMVEGSVRQAGERVRVTAQLIATETGEHLWAERYDRDLEDIFAVQDEITRAVAAAVEPELGTAERERSRRKPPGSLNAWDWYQRGLWHMYQDTKSGNAEALRHLRRAIELDPDFARAYAALSLVQGLDIIAGHGENSSGFLDEALGAAEKAVALDQKDAMAHMVLGRINLLRCNHDGSIAELESAIALNPSYADAYHSLGFSLIFAGRPEDAVPQFDTAIRLSPYDPRISSFHEMRAWALLVMGHDETAAKSAHLSVQRPNAQHWAYATLSSVLGHLGRFDEARAARDELLKRKPDFSTDFVRRFVYYNKNPDHLERYIEGLVKAGLT
jgi:adenylate cyclase